MMATKDIEILEKLLEEKLNGVLVKMDANFSITKGELGFIKEQVTKTNSRVNHLEDDVSQLKKDGIMHNVNCPVSPKIDKINEELMEYRMIKKYPKIAIGIFVVMCLMYLATSLEFNRKLNKISNDNPNTEITNNKE